MAGWIKLHRQIQEHWIWQEKPFDKRSAWIDILLLANHDDTKFVLGNELIEVERGSFITSELKLMARWGWSKAKVRSFLKVLQSDKMIVKKSDKKKTTIYIENYNNYQDGQTTEEPQKNHRETTEKPQKDTNKNVKNDKNVKNNIYSVFDSYSENEDLRQALRDYSFMRNKIKAPLTDRAAAMLVNKLDTLAATDDLKIKILEQAILSNWKSVYPLKQEQAQQPKQQQGKPNKFHNFIQHDYEKDYGNLEELSKKKFEKQIEELKRKKQGKGGKE